MIAATTLDLYLDTSDDVASAFLEASHTAVVTQDVTRPRLALIDYARETAPTWDWDAPHLRWTAEQIDALQAGARVCLEIPIRHGKSELATIRYAAKRIIDDPTCRVLIGANAGTLAKKFSRKIRRLVLAAGIALSSEVNTAAEWQTAAGGGVRAVGMGAATAGEGCDVLIIDDPIANREQAESATIRERIWDAITSDFLSRLEPDGVALVTMSRWHEDDPIGRLRDGRAGDGWTFLRLPGEAEASDPLGRVEGEALWPTRWPLEKLAQRRLQLGDVAYAGLIQQSPQPKGGSMFRWEWWQALDVVPATVGPVVRYWDIAGTEAKKGKHDPDYTVGVLMGRMADKRFVVLDVVRIRASIGKRDAQMRATMLEDHARFGGRLRYWIERPTGMGGEDQAVALRQALAGVVVQFETPTTDKATRAAPLASHVEGALVALAPGDWHSAFKLEFSAFPRGKHDDQVDATSGAFAKVALVPPSVVTSSSFSR